MKGKTVVEKDDEFQRPVDKNSPRRKGPIVNQRGPSELSRAIQMMSNLGARPGAGRKPGGSSSRGTVVRLDRAKGYGFLVDSAGEQRFFHRTAVLDGGFDALQEQQSVDFEPYADDRGARAQKVRPAGAAAKQGAPQTPKPAPKAPKAPAWKSDLSPFRNGSSPANRRRPKI